VVVQVEGDAVVIFQPGDAEFGVARVCQGEPTAAWVARRRPCPDRRG